METDKQTSIAQELSAPMEFQWRVKSFYKQGVDKKDLKAGNLPEGTKGQFLAYIDARDVFDRLDEAVGPDKWQDKWDLVDATANAVRVSITVEIDGKEVTKSDVGYPNGKNDEEPLKSAVSDGVKRTAVHFGIGRFLYELEPVWSEVDKWGKPLKKLETSLPDESPGIPCEVPGCKNTINRSSGVGNRAAHEGHTICAFHSKNGSWQSALEGKPTVTTDNVDQELEQLFGTAPEGGKS